MIPDSTTAGAMRRPELIDPPEKIEFTKIENRNAYMCPQGNVLTYTKRDFTGGQSLNQYKTVSVCMGCQLSDRCLTKSTNKHRYLNVQEYVSELRDFRVWTWFFCLLEPPSRP